MYANTYKHTERHRHTRTCTHLHRQTHTQTHPRLLPPSHNLKVQPREDRSQRLPRGRRRQRHPRSHPWPPPSPDRGGPVLTEAVGAGAGEHGSGPARPGGRARPAEPRARAAPAEPRRAGAGAGVGRAKAAAMGQTPPPGDRAAPPAGPGG